MKTTVLLLSFALASLAQATAVTSVFCAKGRISTAAEGGAVLVDVRGNPIGSIPNPQGLTPEEKGLFRFSYVSTQQDEITLLQNVVKVGSCSK